jgi:septal ring factor EnvC (AmiA/AmiB activator)
LHRFGYTGFPVYHGRPYRQLGLGRCKVHVDIPAHPTDPTMTAWFTTAQGDDLDDTLERVAHQALTEFCERHLLVLGDTAIALLPVRNEGNAVFSERVTAIGDPESSTHHAGWALSACYAQHVSSLLQEVTTTGAHLRLRLEECADQVKVKNRVVKDIQKGNRELLQNNAHLETRIQELSDELMRTYRSHDFKTDDLDDTRTRLQHTQEELVAAQSYVHHLKTELHERDEQLEASQAQTADLQHQVEHLQELIPEEPGESEEDPEEIEGMSNVDDD